MSKQECSPNCVKCKWLLQFWPITSCKAQGFQSATAVYNSAECKALFEEKGKGTETI